MKNGCMEFVPGSHVDEELLKHHSLNDDNRIPANELHPGAMHHVDNVVCVRFRPAGPHCTAGSPFATTELPRPPPSNHLVGIHPVDEAKSTETSAVDGCEGDTTGQASSGLFCVTFPRSTEPAPPGH